MRFKRYCCLLLAAALIFVSLPVTAQAAESHPNTYVNTGDQRTDIIGVARTQVGYYETGNNYTKYGGWYGLQYNPWCAMFITWCARQAGIPNSIIKTSARARPDRQGFNVPYYNGASYTPKPGDIFFTKNFGHTGLVYHVDGEYFYSIEGNSNNDGSADGNRSLCLKRKISSFYFGVPNYATAATPAKPEPRTESKQYYTGQNVVVEWDALEGVESYKVIVYCNADIIHTEQLGNVTSYQFEPQTTGYYMVSISGKYADGKESFNQCVFDVVQGPRLYVRYNASGGVVTPVYQYVVANAGGVAFRASYSTSAKKLGMIPVGTYLNVSQVVYSGGYSWGNIVYNGRSGWCVLSSGLCSRIGYGVDSSSMVIAYPSNLMADTYWNVYSSAAKALTDPETFGLSKAHNAFVGWATEPDGGGRIFRRDETEIKVSDLLEGSVTSNQYMTLYAVWQKLVEAITIEASPAKTEYYAEEDLDTTGLKIKVKYVDGTEEVLDSGFAVSGFDPTQTGDQYITVSFRDKQTSFKVTVDTRLKYAVEGDSVVITDYEQGDSGIVIIPSFIGGKPVTAIAESAFADCDNITAIVIPSSVTQINENAFIGCAALTAVNFTGSQEQWDTITIGSGNDVIEAAVLTCNYMVRGDFTEDMKVDSNDVLYLLKHTLFADLFPVNQSANVNGDDTVDSNDVMFLLKHSLFPDLFPLEAGKSDTTNPEGDPNGDPNGEPIGDPNGAPDGDPNSDPNGDPNGDSDGDPNGDPNGEPNGDPNGAPDGDPNSDPNGEPNGDPNGEPDGDPNSDPNGDPNGAPDGDPNGEDA